MATLTRETTTKRDIDRNPTAVIERHYKCCNLGFDETIKNGKADLEIDIATNIGQVKYCPKCGNAIININSRR